MLLSIFCDDTAITLIGFPFPSFPRMIPFSPVQARTDISKAVRGKANRKKYSINSLLPLKKRFCPIY